MTFHLCHACSTIYEVPAGLPLVCPKCRHLLSGDNEEDDDCGKSWTEVVSEAAHGKPPRIRSRWSIE